MSNLYLKTFRWKGKNKFCQLLKGKTDASDSETLSNILKQQGIVSHHIYPVYSIGTLLQRIKYSLLKSKKSFRLEVLFILRQLSMLLSAHMPLVQAFQVIENHQYHSSLVLKKILHDIRLYLQKGYTLSEAFRRHSHYFSEFFCRWIEAGEYSGTLDTLLEYWIVYQEQNEQLRQKIKKSLTYPAFIFITAIGVMFILFVYVIPIFEKLFHQMDAELPILTQCIITMAYFIKVMIMPLLFLFGIIVGGLLSMRNNFPSFWFYWDRLRLNIPFIGKLLREITLARFARTLSVLLSAGFTLSDSLECTAKVMNNRFLTQVILHCQKGVIAGIPLSQMMESFPYFSSLLKQMIVVAETSGTLEKMLLHTAVFYEKSITHSLDRITEILEPMIMIVMGGMAGIFILSMYLPIFKLGALF